MRVLLDECIDRRLARLLKGHMVRTVPQMGWSGLSNGRLLTRAQGQFDVFVTMDRNLAIQQHVPRFRIAVLVLSAPTNRLDDVAALVPEILAAIPTCQPGTVTHIGASRG